MGCESKQGGEGGDGQSQRPESCPLSRERRPSRYCRATDAARVVPTSVQAAWRYLTGFFIIDLVSTIPWDMLELLEQPGASDTGDLAKTTKMLRLMRLSKLLKVMRASRLFQRWEKAIVLRVRSGVIRMVKFFFTMLVIVRCPARRRDTRLYRPAKQTTRRRAG